MLEPYLNQITVGRAEDVLPQLPARSITLFVFSPPYNLNQRALHSGSLPGITRGVRLRRLSHSRADAPYHARGGNHKWRNGVAYDGYADDLPWNVYRAWQQDVLRKAWDCLTDDGAIFYVHKPRVQNGECILPTSYNPGLSLRQVIIWKRAGGVNMATTHYMPTHEWICIFAKPDFRLKSKGASGVGDVWAISQERNTWHPAPFPPALVERIFDTVGLHRIGVVCDPFAGSGTTGIVALRHGLDFIGIERSALYAARARRAIAAAEGRDDTPADELGPLFAWNANAPEEPHAG